MRSEKLKRDEFAGRLFGRAEARDEGDGDGSGGGDECAEDAWDEEEEGADVEGV